MIWEWRWLMVWCALFGGRSLGVAWGTLTDLETYQTVGAVGAPIVRSGCYTILGVALVWITVGLYQRRVRALQAALPLLISYVVFDNLWLVTYAQPEYARVRLPFVAVTSIVFLGFSSGIWFHLRKNLE